MKNLKDKITNICGLVLLICGSLIGLVQAGIVLPQWLNTTAIILCSIAGSIMAYYTGKNADGTKKDIK